MPVSTCKWLSVAVTEDSMVSGFGKGEAQANSDRKGGVDGMIKAVTDQAIEALELFNQTGAYLRGHFRLTSGLHSPEYLQCALVLAHPQHAEELGKQLARLMQGVADGRKADVVVAPAMGGLIIGHEVARALGARFLFTERDAAGKMILRRGFRIEPGENAMVVEDVITTGGSSREVVELLHAAGAHVLAVGSIIDRSGGAADLGVKRAALATLQVVSYPAESCPMCKAGTPVDKPGSRPAGSRPS